MYSGGLSFGGRGTNRHISSSSVSTYCHTQVDEQGRPDETASGAIIKVACADSINDRLEEKWLREGEADKHEPGDDRRQ